MGTITYTRDRMGNFTVRRDDGKSIYLQTDYDWPGLASNFGWRPLCGCTSTDGTIACLHKTAAEHIADASNFLDDHEGETAEDPGYFGEG